MRSSSNHGNVLAVAIDNADFDYSPDPGNNMVAGEEAVNCPDFAPRSVPAKT
jgi:hypothetical protein